MPATWPASLPADPQVRSYEERTPVNVIRTEMDVGPAKVRRRTTGGVRVYKMVFHMTPAQVATFDAFLADTLGDGSLPFEFAHPRTGVTGTWRIRPPASYTSEKVDEVWWVTLDLEQLPT